MLEKIGKYPIIRSLGKGATAVVYLARDPDLDCPVAIKLIRFGEENAAMSRRLRKLFQTEDAIGRRLNHPNIVKIFDAVVEPDQAYLVMEFLKGETLNQRAKRGALGLPDIVRQYVASSAADAGGGPARLGGGMATGRGVDRRGGSLGQIGRYGASTDPACFLRQTLLHTRQYATELG